MVQWEYYFLIGLWFPYNTAIEFTLLLADTEIIKPSAGSWEHIPFLCGLCFPSCWLTHWNSGDCHVWLYHENLKPWLLFPETASSFWETSWRRQRWENHYRISHGFCAFWFLCSLTCISFIDHVACPLGKKALERKASLFLCPYVTRFPHADTKHPMIYLNY